MQVGPADSAVLEVCLAEVTPFYPFLMVAGDKSLATVSRGYLLSSFDFSVSVSVLVPGGSCC